MGVCKTFRYRIYPTRQQQRRLEEWQNALRFLWNLAHEQRLLGLTKCRTDRKYYAAFDQINQLTSLRAALPWIADVPRGVATQLLVELDKAWQRWFRKLAKKPAWKRKHGARMTLCEPNHRHWRHDSRRIRFPKLGWVRAVFHRPLEGTMKTCTLVCDVDQWFAHVVCEVQASKKARGDRVPVGLDRGITNLVADSDGVLTKNPGFLKRQSRRIARAQRAVSRRKKGSKNREKARLRLARLHRTVRRQRDWYLHQIANRYAKNHGTVIVEKLQVANMTRSAKGTVEAPGKNVRAKSRLNRAILDSGWGRLVEMLRYKCEWSGGALIEVPAAYSSQTCAACGHVAAENRLSQARFICVACGHRDHADINAAKVLLSRGIHGEAVCGGSASGRPVKQKLRVVRRGPS